jgi:hypothetical protein
MSNSVLTLTLNQQSIRGMDSNSLLRLYDLAHAILNRFPSQQERDRADKAIQRIAKELKQRNVSLCTGHE